MRFKKLILPILLFVIVLNTVHSQSKSAAGKSIPAKSKSTASEPSKSVPAKSESAKSEPVKSDSTNPDSAKSETTQPETAKGEPIRIIISSAEPFYFEKTKTGFEYELAEKISFFLNRELQIMTTQTSEELFSKLENDEADIALGVSSSIDRGRKDVYFSDAYIETTYGAVIDKYSIPQDPEGNVIPMNYFNNIYDLRTVSGLTFAVRENSSSHSFLKEAFPSYPINPYEDDEIALSNLESNNADVFVTDSLYLEYLLKKKSYLKNKYKIILKPSYKKSICLVVNKKQSLDLVYRLNFLIKELTNTNFIQKLKTKYFN